MSGGGRTVVKIADLALPTIVRKNGPVTLIFEVGALRVETFGIAKEKGAMGDPVRVENLKTRKIVTGLVAGHGIVKLNR